RTEDVREGPPRAVQVPARHRVHGRAAEDRHRQDPALPPARARGARRDMTTALVDIEGDDGTVSIEHAWIARSRRDAPLLVFLHEGLGSVAMWRDWPREVCDAAGARGLVHSREGYGRSTPRRPGRQWPPSFMHR